MKYLLAIDSAGAVGGTRLQRLAAVGTVMAILLALPLYALLTFDGAIKVAANRWFATPILVSEAIVIALCFAGGWRPIAVIKELPRTVLIGLAVWLTGSTLASAFAADPSRSFIFQAMWMLHGLFGLALWSQLSGPWQNARLPILLVFISGLILHSVAVYGVAALYSFREPVSWEAYSVGVVNPRHYVFYASTMLGLAAGLLSVSQTRRETLLALALLFAAYHLSAWAGGRNSFGVALLFPIVFAAICRQRWKLVLASSYGCAALAFPLTLLTAPPHPIYGFHSVIDRIIDNFYGQGVAAYGYSSGRWDLWMLSLSKFLEKPFLGHGQFQFDQVMELTGWPEEMTRFLHPHNAAVQFLYDWGLVATSGIALAVLPFILTVRHRIAAMPRIALPAFAALLAMAMTSMLDGTYFFNPPLFLTAALLALLGSVPLAKNAPA